MIIENRRDEGVRLYEDISPTMRAAWGTGGGNVPMILDDEKYGIEMYSMANGSHTLEKYGTDISPTLTSRMGTGGNQVPVFVEKDMVLNDQGGSSISVDNKSPTLRAEAHGNMPCVVDDKANTLRANAGAIKHMADLKGRTVVEHTAYSFDSVASNSMKSKNPNSGCREVDISKTIDTSDPNPSKNQGGIAIVTKSYAVAQNQRGECRTDENKSYALTATDGSRPGQSRPCIVEGVNYQGCKSASNTFKDICPTLEAAHGHDVHVIKQDSYCIAGNTIDRKIENGGNGAGFQKDISYTLNTIDRHAVTESRIRRLTPLECERLQGLPDNWTDVPSVDHKGNIKPASDSSRYKAIGNGMAQPCADFVLEQLAYYANNR